VKTRLKTRDLSKFSIEYGAVWTSKQISKPITSTAYGAFESEEDYIGLQERLRLSFSSRKKEGQNNHILQLRAIISEKLCERVVLEREESGEDSGLSLDVPRGRKVMQ